MKVDMPVDTKKIPFNYEAAIELTNLSEKDLQGTIVEPLLRALGFENVRDNSGADEKGKDIASDKKVRFWS